jgi:hypothetical protein
MFKIGFASLLVILWTGIAHAQYVPFCDLYLERNLTISVTRSYDGGTKTLYVGDFEPAIDTIINDGCAVSMGQGFTKITIGQNAKASLTYYTDYRQVLVAKGTLQDMRKLAQKAEKVQVTDCYAHPSYWCDQHP